MAMKEAPKVYIRDQAYAWLPGSIVLIKEGKAVVRIELSSDWHNSTVLCQDSGLEELEDALAAAESSDSQDAISKKTASAFRSVPLAAYPNSQLPLQNKAGHKGDMASLPHLHEAAMLYNLKERNLLQKPYTRVQDVIVAVNPFARIEELYSLQMQQAYAEQLVWFPDERKQGLPSSDPIGKTVQVEPHIYEISCLAYRGVAVDVQDQTILVTGESGSGKTETVKILLEHLATLEFLCPDQHMAVPSFNFDVVNKLMESSVVLEAFGNAKTRRNNNSSRFGKLLQLQFTTGVDMDSSNRSIPSSCSLVGSRCTTYLLEKTRVVSHAVGERSFHIFYQLLAAPEDFRRALWPSFASRKPTDFSYLAQFGECNLENLGDANQWKSTVNALRTFGIEGELQSTLMRALAIVLQLGNIRFGESLFTNGERKTVVTTTDELHRLCKMIGIGQEDLESSLTSRAIKTNFEELRAPVQPAQAKENVDALAKEIYTRIFQFIVRQINGQMNSSNEDDITGTISLIDIYGFERLAVNRFEQLCINYANEQLQQKYVADNFRILKQEYDQEGIDIFDFSLVDNSDVINLMDGRSGVFVALQEECVRPMANDESFVQKMKKVNESHPRLVNEKLYSKLEFGIRHFAGPVTYDATRFVDRNMDRVSEDLLYCAARSTNNLIRNELQRSSRKLAVKSRMDESGRNTATMTLIEKFSMELRDLLLEIEGTQTRYIRCIIPNETRSPGVTDHLMTLRQLEYAGLMTSVALTRESLPDSLSYKTLLARFGCLLRPSEREKMKEMEVSDQIVYMLTNLFMPTLRGTDGAPPSMPFACGTTKAYLRAGALEHLETLRYRFFFLRAMVIQARVRRWLTKTRYHRMRSNAILLQAAIRRFLTRRRSRQRRAAVHLLVSWWRGHLVQRAFRAKLRVLRMKQAELHAMRASKMAKQKANKAAGTIQSRWRAFRAQAWYWKLCKSAITVQRAFRSSQECKSLQHHHEPLPMPHPVEAAIIVQRAFRSSQERTSLQPHQEPLPMQHPVEVAEETELESHDVLRAMSQAKKNLALRKASIPRFRRADHSLLAEIEALLGTVSSEFETLLSQLPVDETDQSTGGSERTTKAQDIGELESLRQENSELRAQCDKMEEATAEMASTVDNLLDRETRRVQKGGSGSQGLEKMTGELAKLNQQIMLDDERHKKELDELQKLLREKDTLHRADMARTKAAHLDQVSNMKAIHMKEVKWVEAKLDRIEKHKLEALSKASASQTVHSEQLERLQVDLMKSRTENATLREKLEQRDESTRAEKEELCKMIQESEGKYKEESQNLKEELRQANEEQDRLRSELDDFRSQYDEDIEAAATRFASNLTEYETRKIAAEHKLVQMENEFAEEIDRLRKSNEDIKSLAESNEKVKGKLHDDLVLAQEVHQALKSEISMLKTEKEKLSADQVGYQKLQAVAIELRNAIEQHKEREEIAEERLREAMDTAESRHREEVGQLREELFWTQENQRQLKSELSEMEASHAEELERTKIDCLDDFHETNEALTELEEKLERQERNFRDEKEELCKMLNAAELAHEEELLKLNEEVQRAKENQRKIKSDSNKLQAAHAEEIEKMMTKTIDYYKKDAEIESWKDKTKRQEEQYKEEKERLRLWLKNHLEDVRTLKKEFEGEQESHIMHLLHVLAELEDMQTARDKAVEDILVELGEMGKEKDAAIEALKTELELKQSTPTEAAGLSTILEGDEMSKGEINDLQERLAKSSTMRSAHFKEFNTTLHKLQMAVKPSNLKYILKKLRKQQDSTLETKVLTEIHRMSVALGEIIASEDDEQQLLQAELSAFFERFSAPSEAAQEEDSAPKEDSPQPGAAESKPKTEVSIAPNPMLQNLQERIEAIEKHNRELKDQLRANTKMLVDPNSSLLVPIPSSPANSPLSPAKKIQDAKVPPKKNQKGPRAMSPGPGIPRSPRKKQLDPSTSTSPTKKTREPGAVRGIHANRNRAKRLQP
ncbi:Unconventional myosin [Seminavis robusta]|uniref:Unconventional myosin n=1 Tax=Seminavis robusta TaxID=568900 RepID=A0A9N8DIR4_9STRA|nr:Unconventional myosin [Seminavis robusta]|eukprot:Sro110_g054920.1 Unconventional myosin (1983) ;mRNA; r:62870-68998